MIIKEVPAMRVMLINPPIDSVLEHGNVSPVTQYLFYNSAPLGILYIAAVLEQEGHVVEVIDAAAELLDVEKTVTRVAEFQPDLIGIGSFTVTFETTKKLGEQLKEQLPEVPIVLGSYHVTLVPEKSKLLAFAAAQSELSIVYAELINVNAYHQPGVEAGKKAAAAVLEMERRSCGTAAAGGAGPDHVPLLVRPCGVAALGRRAE